MCLSSFTFHCTDKVDTVSGDSGHDSSHTDTYDELFKTISMADLDPLDSDQEETGNKVTFCLIEREHKMKTLNFVRVQSSS